MPARLPQQRAVHGDQPGTVRERRSPQRSDSGQFIDPAVELIECPSADTVEV